MKNSVSGFTLIELLVVLSVIGFLFAIAAPMIGKPPASLSRSDAGARLAIAVLSAKRDARTTGRPTIIDISRLAPSMRSEPLLGGDGAIIVYPDGSSTGGTIYLADRPLAQIDWLTGRVDDAR